MVKQVARVFKWTPTEIGNLYVDNAGIDSIIFWYEDANKYIEEIGKIGGL